MLRFSLKAIRVEIGASFAFGLLAAGLADAGLTFVRLPATSWPTLLVAGACAAVAFAVSLAAHELGHAVAALGRGIPVRRIRLFGSGGSCERGAELRTPTDECMVAGAGPGASALLALVALLVGALAFEPGSVGRCAAILTAVGNGLLAATNLIPVYPLDGGKLVHALLWRLSGDARGARSGSARLGRLAATGVVMAGLGICTVGTDLAVGSIVSAAGAYLLRFPGS